MEIDFFYDSSAENISGWLRGVLARDIPVPSVGQDERPHLVVNRLASKLKGPALRSIYEACKEMLDSISDIAREDPLLAEELISLSMNLKIYDIVPVISKIARDRIFFQDLPRTLKFTILEVLVDLPPERPIEFWDSILQLDAAEYAGICFTGMLSISPYEAIKILPWMPDNKEFGEAFTINLQLHWEIIPASQRLDYVESIRSIASKCGSNFFPPILHWINSLGLNNNVPSNEKLRAALFANLGKQATPRSTTSKLTFS
jgi:hypothetical protein